MSLSPSLSVQVDRKSLHWAAGVGNEQALRLLLVHDTDVDERDTVCTQDLPLNAINSCHNNCKTLVCYITKHNIDDTEQVAESLYFCCSNITQ